MVLSRKESDRWVDVADLSAGMKAVCKEIKKQGIASDSDIGFQGNDTTIFAYIRNGTIRAAEIYNMGTSANPDWKIRILSLA